MRLLLSARPLKSGAVCVLAGLLSSGQPVQAQNAPVTVSVNVSTNRRAISPLIYGMNYADGNLSDLNCPIHRLGGNNLSRYNWQINADNRGADWYYESIGDTSSAPCQRYFDFVTANKAAGAESMVTIPMIHWVAKLGTNRSKLASFPVSKYGAQQYTDYWFPNAGNGVRKDGSLITADPNNANVYFDSTVQKGIVTNMVGRYGTALAGGVRYYLMDNEPSIWHSTHRDVQPNGWKMEDIAYHIKVYGKMVKAKDPGAQVCAPEEWGWAGYLFSGYDQQYCAKNGWAYQPDKAAHGNMDYVPYLLKYLKNDEIATGLRSIDVLSLHYYPQGGEFGNDISNNMQLLRNRSTRALWDPGYVDASWINDKVTLIPRMKQWVNTYYPGLKTAITEYSWGADAYASGAIAQADIFGIFGREGLDIANRWTSPSKNTPVYNAIKMYRNYDGAKGSFGDTSVSASVPNPDILSTFASQDSVSGAVKIMVIAKALTGVTPVTVNIANFVPGSNAQVYQWTGAGNAISRLTDVPVTTGAVNFNAPAQSITLFVIPAQ